MLGEAALEPGASLDPGLSLQLQATASYKPAPFPGKVTYVRASTTPLPADTTRNGWASVAIGGLDLRIVESTHYGLIRPPSVDKVADLLEELLSVTTN